MRWLVEVSSLSKSDSQKYCVEAESWQRALQAARSQRGEEGPMSGFSIELLEEGYRAVDPVARVRFVVKRAPDDMPITVTASKEIKGGTKPGLAPSASHSQPPGPSAAVASVAPPEAAPTDPKMTPPPTSSAKDLGDSSSGDKKKSIPPRPALGVNAAAVLSAIGVAPKTQGNKKKGNDSKPSLAPGGGDGNAAQTLEQTPEAKKKAATMTFGGPDAVTQESAKDEARPAPPVGTAIPGLPLVKLLSSREQEPTESSPLTYREYAFAVPAGTNDQAAADLLRAQLRIVESHIAHAKQGKLVNLAAFDVEFTGKPPKAPIATLTWKDWKGEPVIAFPRRSGKESVQPRPPSKVPSATTAAAAPVAVPPPAPIPQIAQPFAPAPAPAPAPPPAPVPTPARHHGSVPPPAYVHAYGSAHSPAGHGSVRPPEMMTAPVQPIFPGSVPGSVPPPAHVASAPPPAAVPAPIMTLPQAHGSTRPSSSPNYGMVRSPSGRFVRGRLTGDELITSLFESMHDLHFLRDALDGGQFCLALATEVLPARAALIHFFDIEKREWVCACTRGKDTHRLLNARTPEADDLLRSAAKKRRAVLVGDASAQATANRYQAVGGARSIIIAPVMQAGRALGAIEIINPLDGMPFSDDEAHAMQYIAEQYAEYLGSRGIVLDRHRIESAAAAR